MEIYDVIIVGAGAAGLLAAGSAAESGGRVLVLEKMKQEGCKIMVTGNGRCNITNNASIKEFIRHIYINGKFVRKALSNFFSDDIISILKQNGVNVKLESSGRYFPESNRSADVLKALLKWVNEKGVEIKCNFKVEKLLIENNEIKGVQANGKKFLSKSVILATGGKSYPATGSTGEGYDMAKKAGHSLINIRPSLVPLETKENYIKILQGISLKDIKASIWINGKKEKEEKGEMLFTHYGLSGPLILILSRYVVDALIAGKKAEVSIDLNPEINEHELDIRLQKKLNENGKKKPGNVFKLWLPSSVVPVFMKLCNIDPEKECHQITSKERKQVRNLLKNFRFQIINYRSFKEAIVTAGGINIDEITSDTMESKLVSGLFFAGEIMDVDAETGGFNLQIAWSTGWLAGKSCMKNKKPGLYPLIYNGNL